MLVYFKSVFQIDKFRYENSIYFKAAHKSKKISSKLAHNLFVFGCLKKKKVNENQIEKKKKKKR